MPADSKHSATLVDDGLGGLTYRVIGLAMAVHRDLGPGHREMTYHRAMVLRLADAGLKAEKEPTLPIMDEHGRRVNFYVPDHRVEGRLLLEYKAHRWPLTNDDLAQGIDYLAGCDCRVLLLFNFGRKRLDWRRVFAPLTVQAHQQRLHK